VSAGAVQIDRLQEQLKRLKLVRTADQLAALLQEAGKKELPYSDFLEELLGRELTAKQERHTAMKTSMARFPFHKSLESFDFKFQPSIDPEGHPRAGDLPLRRQRGTTCFCSARLGAARRIWRWPWA